MSSKQKIIICGATGFIGRNILERFLDLPEYELYAIFCRTQPPQELARDPRVRFLKADLRIKNEVDRILSGADILIQAAATTSGAKDILGKPYHHVTDNAIMNSLVFRSCYENRVKHVVFFSCTVMYGERPWPIRESDFDYQIMDQYFGVGWTKVYLEKMCEFYARISGTKYTVIRHSNIYGPHDKYDLERSHVFGATIAKAMTVKNGQLTVWGDGTEERDLLHVGDLVRFVHTVLSRQSAPFELINIGAGRSISIKDLVTAIVARSKRDLRIEFDKSKPTIPYKLALNIDRAKNLYGWSPQIRLEDGIDECLSWYREHYMNGRDQATQAADVHEL